MHLRDKYISPRAHRLSRTTLPNFSLDATATLCKPVGSLQTPPQDG